MAVTNRLAAWRAILARTPLFYRLLAALLLVSLIPTVPIFYLSYRYVELAASTRAEKDLSQQISILIGGFDDEYRVAPQRSLKQIAGSDALVNLQSGPQEERLVNGKVLESLFFNIAKEHETYSGIFFIDADGRLVASVVDRQRTSDPGSAPSWRIEQNKGAVPPTIAAGDRLFRRISTTPALLSAGNMEWFMPPRDVLVEGPYVDERGRPSLLVGISTLDVDSGAFSGAAIIRLNLSPFIDMLGSVQVFDERLAWLFDAQGARLLSPAVGRLAVDPWPALVAAKSGGVAETRVLRNPAGLVAYRDIEASDKQVLMRVAVSVPYELISRDFQGTRAIFLVALLVSLVAASAIAYLVSVTISKPIVRLAEAAQGLAAGELSRRVKGVSGGEMGVLVSSFNSMAENLQLSMQALSQQTTVVDKAPFGILIIDPYSRDKLIRYFNEAFAELLGYTRDQVIGRHPSFMYGPGIDQSVATQVERALVLHEATEVELPVRAADGRELIMRWMVFPCHGPQGDLISSVIFQSDVTEIRKTEREREQLAAEIQESNKLQFLSLTIAGMAHDLNTPIGVGVTGASQMQRMVARLREALARDPVDTRAIEAWSQKIDATAEIVGRNLEKAGQLVQGFKKTSADATRTEWTTVNLDNLLQSLVIALSPLMKRAHCVVHINCPPGWRLYTEPGSVSQAITNLLINATLHAFDGLQDRQIAISVTGDEQEVLIVVADNGNGMTEEAAVKAFTPFFTTKRGSGGSGLGLFSSRRVVEEVLRGKIRFESSPGSGTRFFITLPRIAAGRQGQSHSS